MEDIEKELEREVNEMANDISRLTDNEEIEKFLSDIVDIQIIKSLTENQYNGFDILINFGGPNIKFEYNRGHAELTGTWGNAEYKKYINPEVAENILEYLNEILNC